MIPTLPFVNQKFADFNALVFQGCLPPIPVKLSRARSFLGKVQYKKTRGLFGITLGTTDCLMRVSTLFDLPENEWEDVILHEMIHYYIIWKGIRDTSTHGKVFRQYMERINREFGRNITVQHKAVPTTPNPVASEPRLNNVCVSLLQGDKWGVTVCSDAMKPRLNRSLPRHYIISRKQWFQSTDPFFNKFPRSRTAKIYKIAPEELEAHLEGFSR